jgi:YHS domain-containing protein
MRATLEHICAAGMVLSIALAGCKEKEPSAAATPAVAAPTTQPQAIDTGDQTLCPVGGGKIDPKVFTEYKGKRVYFCCEGCIEPFKKNPEKYVKKLPQFGGKEEPGSGGMNMQEHM